MEHRIRLANAGVCAALAALVAFTAFMGWIGAAPGAPAHSNALWHVVHDLCVTDMRLNHTPAPCTAVDLNGRFAVLKDMRGATQMLLIPTDRVTGIEDPKLLAPDSLNYWQDAWSARRLFEQRAGRPVPRDDIALAVNSAFGRSQDQLHIHIDCISAPVRAALEARIDRIGPAWAPLDPDLAGHRYNAMRINGADPGAADPFTLLADSGAAARSGMGRHTLILVGATFPGGGDGFVLLDREANPALLDPGHGEDLMDHSCAVLHRQAG